MMHVPEDREFIIEVVGRGKRPCSSECTSAKKQSTPDTLRTPRYQLAYRGTSECSSPKQRCRGLLCTCNVFRRD